METLKYKRTRTNAQPLRRAHPTDGGLDIAPTEDATLSPGRTVKLDTGIAVEIPEGYVGLLVPRSSVRAKGLDFTGVIDSSYRGDIKICVTNVGTYTQQVEREKYLGQLLIVPVLLLEPVEVAGLSDTARSDGGFGSTDGKP